MAIGNIIKKKIGRELREWVYLGIKTGARRGVEAYEAQKVTNLPAAILQLKRAIDMAHRARARINYAISIHGLPLITEVVAFDGTTTISELNSALTTMENYFEGLVVRQQGGESWDSLAADIASQVEKESDKWTFPFPPNYTDIWSE